MVNYIDIYTIINLSIIILDILLSYYRYISYYRYKKYQLNKYHISIIVLAINLLLFIYTTYKRQLIISILFFFCFLKNLLILLYYTFSILFYPY